MGNLRSLAACGWREVLRRKRADGEERGSASPDVHVVRERVDGDCILPGLPDDAGGDVLGVPPSCHVNVERWD